MSGIIIMFLLFKILVSNWVLGMSIILSLSTFCNVNNFNFNLQNLKLSFPQFENKKFVYEICCLCVIK